LRSIANRPFDIGFFGANVKTSLQISTTPVADKALLAVVSQSQGRSQGGQGARMLFRNVVSSF